MESCERQAASKSQGNIWKHTYRPVPGTFELG
jgi:hypothetical protein